MTAKKKPSKSTKKYDDGFAKFIAEQKKAKRKKKK